MSESKPDKSLAPHLEQMVDRGTVMEYPCDFPIKAMGISCEDFDAIIVNIINKHVDDIKEGAVTSKQSSTGKFTSITVIIQATSQDQVEAIYQELKVHKQVHYVL